MQLTVTTLSDEIFTLDVGEDLDLASFKGLCELEVGVPAQQIAILWNGRPLQNDKLTLKDYGINNGDMLLLQQIQGQAGQSLGAAGQLPSSSGIYSHLTLSFIFSPQSDKCVSFSFPQSDSVSKKPMTRRFDRMTHSFVCLPTYSVDHLLHFQCQSSCC